LLSVDIAAVPGRPGYFCWRLRAGNGRLLGLSAEPTPGPDEAQSAFRDLLDTRPCLSLITCAHAPAGFGWEWWLRSEAGSRIARSGRIYERNAHCRRGSLHFITALENLSGN
jgi:hypothetical protein